MMSRCLAENREELIRRCAAKVSKRPHRQATEAQLSNGIALFLGQLQRTLEAEELHSPVESLKISGAPGGEASTVSEMGASATMYGKQLLDLGFTSRHSREPLGLRAARHSADVDARIAALAHELASALATATHTVVALELGNLPISGSTGTILKRSLAAMRKRIGGPAIEEVQSGTDSHVSS